MTYFLIGIIIFSVCAFAVLGFFSYISNRDRENRIRTISRHLGIRTEEVNSLHRHIRTLIEDLDRAEAWKTLDVPLNAYDPEEKGVPVGIVYGRLYRPPQVIKSQVSAFFDESPNLILQRVVQQLATYLVNHEAQKFIAWRIYTNPELEHMNRYLVQANMEVIQVSTNSEDTFDHQIRKIIPSLTRHHMDNG